MVRPEKLQCIKVLAACELQHRGAAVRDRGQLLAGRCRVDAGAAGAELQRVQCCTGAHFARNCSASDSAAGNVFAACASLSSSVAVQDQVRMLASAVRAESSVGTEAAGAKLHSLTVPTHDARRNSGAPVSGAAGMLEASATFSSSFSLRHHAWM